jgi:hypothetical protein
MPDFDSADATSLSKPEGLTRRQLLSVLPFAAVGVTACKASILAVGHGFVTGSSSVEKPIMAQPLIVPRDFVGVHAHRWPLGNPLSPAPNYPFGAARSHDYGGASWNSVNAMPGVYDWSRLDAWVKAHSEAGRTLTYTLFGTPAWAAGPDAPSDPYGKPGGSSPPRNLEDLQTFIHTLVSRYNGKGRRGIHFIEIWNEPHFQEYPGPQFWAGSASQLAQMGRIVCQAAKRVDPQIRVLSPGFTGDLAGNLDVRSPSIKDVRKSSIYQHMTASDGNGGVGGQWCDGVAFHVYNAPFSGPNIGFMAEIERLRTLLRLLKLEQLPLIDTEFGFLEPNAFHEKTLAEQAAILRRCAAIQAALGVQGMFFYSHDDDLVGNPSKHVEIASAIGEIHASLAGKRLIQVTLLSEGRVRVETGEQTLLW